MGIVLNNELKIGLQHRHRFLEGNPMLLQIGFCLPRIPDDDYRTTLNYIVVTVKYRPLPYRVAQSSMSEAGIWAIVRIFHAPITLARLSGNSNQIGGTSSDYSAPNRA
jgi:hypothetical protein